VPAYFIVYLVAVGVASKLISGFDASQAQDIGFKNVHGGTALFVTFLSLVVLAANYRGDYGAGSSL